MVFFCKLVKTLTVAQIALNKMFISHSYFAYILTGYNHSYLCTLAAS